LHNAHVISILLMLRLIAALLLLTLATQTQALTVNNQPNAALNINAALSTNAALSINAALSTPNAALSTSHQLSQLKIDAWATEQGLPINTVQTIHQARDGVLWIGTASGLVRFDGVRFSNIESLVVPDLASRAIFGFMEDSEGAIWIGHNRGVARYHNGRFELLVDSTILQSRRAWAFAEATDGSVWIASENGLLRWTRGINAGKGGITKHYKVADGLPTDKLRALTFDRDGVLWIATSGGGLVSMLPNKLGTFTVFNPSNGFPHLEVRHVLSDPAGGVWAATAGAGLVRVMATKSGVDIKTYTVADGLVSNHLTYLARQKSSRADVADEIWIGTWGEGIVRMRDGKFATLSTAKGLGRRSGLGSACRWRRQYLGRHMEWRLKPFE
jgi:ligand-binding sensor domain-containing protein